MLYASSLRCMCAHLQIVQMKIIWVHFIPIRTTTQMDIIRILQDVHVCIQDLMYHGNEQLIKPQMLNRSWSHIFTKHSSKLTTTLLTNNTSWKKSKNRIWYGVLLFQKVLFNCLTSVYSIYFLIVVESCIIFQNKQVF